MTAESDQTKEESNSDQCKDLPGTGAQLLVLDDTWLRQYTKTDLRKLQLDGPDSAHILSTHMARVRGWKTNQGSSGS